ncbi:prolyl-tRNA synthetase [Lawsonella clevelandensis]|uniref:proline--tRNA ligase n=1 Tax=Lawsonella clevelandensis TaxID=1528099 RepID=UPI0006B56204|nr:proline--tRNA ligase [Lawsonella clevelandensis]ALE34195.1 prolyl-tRNA synthetase [Lawsonella clevelandensis]
MITRMSTLFLRTLREDPADAEVASHKLLVRAGYIRRVAPGIYSWLPAGLRVLRNVEKVVREEMDGIGAQQIELPALLPREPYETTNRWTEYGSALFRLKDRKGADYLLGPTHEELFALTVKSQCTSYKDLPLVLYQIQTKYRDEERSRAGLLRCREFVMKDSYSFNVDDAGLAAAYQAHRGAYQRIFNRLGIDYVICTAMSGAMGGSASEEFLAVSPAGEDTFVRSTGSDYAANVEAVRIPAPAAQPIDGQPEMEDVLTPGAGTIDELVSCLQQAGHGEIAADQTLKTLMVKTREPGGEWVPLGIGIPGDRELDQKRLEAAFDPTEVELFEAEDFEKYPFIKKGYIGPLELLDNDIAYCVDPRAAAGTAWVVGGGRPDVHRLHAVVGRDFTPTGVLDVATIREGDPAPDGHGTLTLARGIEIGHIFQLGRKYTNAFELDVLGEDGKPQRVTMGSYGIGVSRLVAVLAEQFHDEKGLRWPAQVAPWDVHVVVANKAEGVAEAAAGMAEQLSAAGLEVLLDDRKASPGVKFKDSELLGMPRVLVIGRGWANGKVELRNRLTGESEEMEPVAALDALTAR